METLIAARAGIHRADTTRATPAHWASLSNNADGLHMLCEARADPLKQNVVGMHVFDTACCNAAIDSMTVMLAQNPETSLRFGLHFAVMFHGGHEKPIQWLIHAKLGLPVAICLIIRSFWVPYELAQYQKGSPFHS